MPKTGIEQAFLAEPPKFLTTTSELERINDISPVLKATIVEDYKLRESSRIINFAKTVYDVEKDSPHYRDQKDFLNPIHQIRIGNAPGSAGTLKMSAKNRYFRELNPWYRPSQYSIGKDKKQTAKGGEQDDVLTFESRFESGNLKEAI